MIFAISPFLHPRNPSFTHLVYGDSAKIFLPKGAYQTALKIISIAALFFAVAYSLFRLYRHFASCSISSPRMPPSPPPSSPSVLPLTPKSDTIKQVSPSHHPQQKDSSPPLTPSDVLKKRRKGQRPLAAQASRSNIPMAESSPLPADLTLDPPNYQLVFHRLQQMEPSAFAQESSALNKLKKALPGYDLSCQFKYKGSMEGTTLAHYLLKTLFREEEIQECTFHENKQFKLIYSEPKTIQLQGLPDIVWKKMTWILKPMMIGLLKISPNLQIAACLEGQIVQTVQGTQVVFKENGISLTKNKLGYKAYLKSILVLSDSKINKRLIIETDHNFKYMDHSRRMHHQLFAEILDINFFPPKPTT